MTATLVPAGVAPSASAGRARGRVAAWLLTAALVGAVAVLAAVHLSQGTAAVDAGDLIDLVLGRGTDADAVVVIASRWPRLAAALAVGVALGAAGCILQGLARNPLASPDTLAVEAGAHLALVASAVFSVTIPILGGVGIAFFGGVVAAAVLLGLTRGGGSPLRLVLAGTVLALALASVTSSLMILNTQDTRGLFAWGAGSLNQRGLDGIAQVTPVILIAVAIGLLLARNLDLLALGEEVARGLGVRVGLNRSVLALAAVLLTAAAVTIAGPIGFVGLSAPAMVALASSRIPPLLRHSWRIPVSALAGVLLVLASDVGLRLFFGAIEGVEVPTGVVTTVVGGLFLAVAAHRLHTGAADPQEGLRIGMNWGRRHPAVLITGVAALVVAAGAAALLLGDSALLFGDIGNWLTGQASRRISFILDARAPRVASALLAGAGLAVAGALVQGVTRNALADPGILGVSTGAGLGAVLTLIAVPSASWLVVTGGAGLGGLIAATALFGLTMRGGLQQTRVVLVGIGLAAAAGAITSAVLVRTDPWNQAKAITWLGGSTYGAKWSQLVPLLIVLVISAVLLAATHADLDLLQVDEDTPRLLAVNPIRTRTILLALAVLLTGAATASIGVLAFVGLVAPHAARLLVGRHHRRLLPLSALLGAVLVVAADTVGRTVLAPNQLPAGLVTALVGAPYFLWLLTRVRAR